MSTQPNLNLLPHDDASETSVLGACLVAECHYSAVAARLKPEDFYRAVNRDVFRAMGRLHSKGEPIDALTVMSEMEGEASLEAVGGYPYIASLLNGIPKVINAEHYAGHVKERSARRALVRLASQLEQAAVLGEQRAETVAVQATADLAKLRESCRQGQKDEWKTGKDMLDEALARIEAAKKGGLLGLKTGFTDFDRLTGGLQRGALTVLAARTSVGKSSWALTAASNIAVQNNVAFFSFEMGLGEMGIRLLVSTSRASSSRVLSGKPSDFDLSRLTTAAQVMVEGGMFFSTEPNVSFEEVRERCRRLKTERGLVLVVVDHINLGHSDSRHDTRAQEVSGMTRLLKLMAIELDIAVLALAQFNREADKRDDKPRLSDLKESSSIEQDADVVAFLHRLRVATKERPTTETDLIVAKHRNGPTGEHKLVFVGDAVRFEDATNRKE